MKTMNELKPLVENRILDLIAEAEQRYNLDEIRFPKIRFDLKGKCGGQFVSGGWKDVWDIRINVEALTKYTEHYIEQTVGHEVGHLVAKFVYGAKGHDYKWKRVMRDFGLPADRCHTYDLTPARRTQKFKYKCACSEHEVGAKVHRKLQLGAAYTCRKCNTRLVGLSEQMAGPSFLVKSY
jgi:SprT protein